LLCGASGFSYMTNPGHLHLSKAIPGFFLADTKIKLVIKIPSIHIYNILTVHENKKIVKQKN